MPGRRWRTIGLAAAAAGVAALALVQTGAAGPGSLGAFFFGPTMVRAEVVMTGGPGGALHDYRIDRGVIKGVTATSITVLERDGTTVTVPVSPTASVRIGGRAVPLLRLRLRLGFVATTVRDGDRPAQRVEVTRNP